MSGKDCSLIQPLLGAYLDGELSSETAQSLAGHLDSCEACRGLLSELAETDRLLRGITPPFPTESQWAEVEQRLFARAQRRTVWRVAKATAFAAAAALLVGALVWVASLLDSARRSPIPDNREAVEAPVEVEGETEEPPIPISIERRG